MQLTLSRSHKISRLNRHPSTTGFGERIWCWFERSRQRRALLRLNQRMLKDIGISRCDAEQEAAKWFFQE